MIEHAHNFYFGNGGISFARLFGAKMAFVFVLGALMLGGCTGPTGFLPLNESLTAGKLTVDGPADPITNANKTGAYPVIGQQPQAQTKQISAAEKAALKSELGDAVTVDSQSESQRANAEYQAEIKRMKKLFDYQSARRKSQNF